jgi:hypothetical protein
MRFCKAAKPVRRLIFVARTGTFELMISDIIVEAIARAIYFAIGFMVVFTPSIYILDLRIGLGIGIAVGLVFAVRGQKFVDDYIRSLR